MIMTIAYAIFAEGVCNICIGGMQILHRGMQYLQRRYANIAEGVCKICIRSRLLHTFKRTLLTNTVYSVSDVLSHCEKNHLLKINSFPTETGTAERMIGFTIEALVLKNKHFGFVQPITLTAVVG